MSPVPKNGGFVHPLVPASREIFCHWAVLWLAAICVSIAVAIRGAAIVASRGGGSAPRAIPAPTARYVRAARFDVAAMLPESMRNTVGAELGEPDMSFRPVPPRPSPVEALFAPPGSVPAPPVVPGGQAADAGE